MKLKKQKRESKMKLKITNQTKEVEGKIENKVVTPFGNSAHIPISRKHSGKILPVIFPEETIFSWILSNEDLEKIIKAYNKILDTEDNRLKHHKRNAIKNLKSKRFSERDLHTVLTMLKKDSKNKSLIKKLNKFYSLED